MRLALAFVPALVAMSPLLACGDPTGPSGTTSTSGAGGGSSCPNDLPASCPSTVPSYAADVAPLIEAHCAPCHFPGSTVSSKHLSTYAEVHALRGPVLNQIHACTMPPEGEPALDAATRAVILGWLVCGAPDN